MRNFSRTQSFHSVNAIAAESSPTRAGAVARLVNFFHEFRQRQSTTPPTQGTEKIDGEWRRTENGVSRTEDGEIPEKAKTLILIQTDNAYNPLGKVAKKMRVRAPKILTH